MVYTILVFIVIALLCHLLVHYQLALLHHACGYAVHRCMSLLN